MNRLVAFITVLMLFSGSCQSSNSLDQKIAGTKWEGFLKVEQHELKLIFKFNEGKCFLEVPAQAVANYPSSKYITTPDSLYVAFSGMMQASFNGKIEADTLIIGHWNQSGKSFPITLRKKKEYIRTQNPRPPFPYKVENVSYFNQDKTIQFGGTLTTPEKAEKYPVAILISGSGQEDRDETLFGHKPFFVIADYLTRHGIAVLRVDDRGIGETTGKETVMKATSYDFAKDVMAGISYLKSRNDIDPMKIGLVGHSEGGIIASLVGSERDDLAFIVSMAGVGVSGKDLVLSQIETALKRSMPQTSVDRILPFEKRAIEIIMNEPNNRSAGVSILQKLTMKWLNDQDSLTRKYYGMEMKYGFQAINLQEVAMRYERMMSPWFRYFLAYSPDSVCAGISVPFLAINGEKDTQVLSGLNLNGFSKIFSDRKKSNYKTINYPGLNHFFQHCNSGYVEEVEMIEETISNDVLNDMTNWIIQQTAHK